MKIKENNNAYFEKSNYAEADKYINEALKFAIDKTIDPINLSKGKLFYSLNNIDSAKYYLTLSSNSSYIYTKAGSFQRLAQIALKEQELLKYVEYTKKYEELRDSITSHSHFENIRLTQSMFNYQHIAKEKNKFEKKATQRMVLIYQIIILFSIILGISFFFIKKEQQKKKRLVDLQK